MSQEAMSEDELKVLSSTAYVVEHSSSVLTKRSQCAVIAARLAGIPLPLPAWDTELHFVDGSARTANYILVLDALNFSFWGEPRWRVQYRGRVLDGYWALAASLKRAIKEGVPLLEAEYLAHLTQPDLEHIFRGEGQIPLLKERLANLHEVGNVLHSKYGGWFSRAIDLADRSAVQLVRQVVADFPSFNDVAHYRNRLVRFYKRAQILVADLYGAFDGKQWGRFDDLDQLTAFADYKVPQILRYLGILEYASPLEQMIESKKLIPAGSPLEVEIRAGTIWGVEYLRQEMARLGQPVRAFELDWYLWDLSQREPGTLRPYHRTRTIFY